MAEVPLPKVNYDDFYKYVVSLSSLLFLVTVIMTSYSMARIVTTEGATKVLNIVSGSVYFALACTCAVTFIWGARRWYVRQRMFDEQLENELLLQLAEINKKRLDSELVQKKLSETKLSFGKLL